MRYVILPLLLLFLVTGCRHEALPVTDPLHRWQETAVSRHLAGEVATALTTAVQHTQNSSRHHEYPDLARFIRKAPAEKANELSRELLWESMELCNVQFVPDPAAMLEKLRAGELRCLAALLIAEKQYLDQIVWKTPEQETRYRELQSELTRLFGSLPFGEIDSIKLVSPGTMPDFSAATAMLTQDPAETLQIAGVISALPDELRRQQFADRQFPLEEVLKEIEYLAAGYALQLDRMMLLEIQRSWQQSPSAEKVLQYRRWYYRAILDISRVPESRGKKEAQQFINSMLLLQESF